MATLIIKDLTDSVELDRQAMAAIVGGARIGRGASVAVQAVQATARIVDYPPGFPAAHRAIADVPSAAAPRSSPLSSALSSTLGSTLGSAHSQART